MNPQYIFSHSGIQTAEINENAQTIIQDALWIDLLNPAKQEETVIEKYLNINIPTREEMREIEPSSRLYTDNSTLFMTAIMIAKSDSPEPKTDAVTFILSEKQLITVRYIEPSSFSVVISKLTHIDATQYKPENLLIMFLESTIDRLADILENITRKIDEVTQFIFRASDNDSQSEKINYQTLLKDIGTNSELVTKASESLMTFSRLVSFFGRRYRSKLDQDSELSLGIAIKDINALSDHANFISNKINFLLDATLGMLNIEQNNIIKVFSVAAVIFLPPTLIASIYGMNFKFIPELNWYVGYPFAIFLMIISAWLPYRYFKKRKWL